MSEQPTLPLGEVQALAERAVQAAREVAENLDYSPQSLEAADRIAAKFRGHPSRERDERGFATTTVAFGCYLGEVLRRNFGGEWIKLNPEGLGLSLGPAIVVEPLLAVAARMQIETAETLPHLFERLVEICQKEERLKAAKAKVASVADWDITARMAPSAELAVADTQDLIKQELDYTEGTLPVLQSMLQRIISMADRVPTHRKALFDASVVKYGAYLGEVIRRNFGGKWVTGLAEAPELPIVDLGSMQAIPLAVIMALLEQSPVDMGEGVFVRDIRGYVDALKKKLSGGGLESATPALDE